MNVVAIRKDVEIKASIPPIVKIKEAIAIGVAELNYQAARGALNSFQITRDRVNQQTDQYISMRKLTLVKE